MSAAHEAPSPRGSAMVATSQVTAVDAGLHVLKQGGNAIDAAVATAACLTVVEPCQNGIGGDCFALVWDGNDLHGLNASGRSPAGWTAERFAGVDRMPADGWESVTVPGQIAGWRAILERFGSRSMEACLEPAIDAKRWRLQNSGVVLLEEGFAPATRDQLIRMGHQIEDTSPGHFGGAQMIIRQDDGTCLGATDPRKDGSVGVLN